jgi:hypothetical protein
MSGVGVPSKGSKVVRIAIAARVSYKQQKSLDRSQHVLYQVALCALAGYWIIKTLEMSGLDIDKLTIEQMPR